MALESTSLTRRQSKVIGALVGLHTGDSLGASLEFQCHTQIRTQYPNGLREIIGGGLLSWPVGQATDDTDMTRALLLAYHKLREEPHQDVAILAGEYFLNWWRGNWPGRKPGSRPRDIGIATSEGLHKFSKTRDPEKAGAGRGKAGNGSLMRCLPTGLFQSDPNKLVEESMRISMITHDDVRCTISCAVYNHIVAALIGDVSPESAVDAGEILAERLENKKDGDVLKAIRLGRQVSLPKMAKEGPNLSDMKGACSGYVLETLALAIAALIDKRSLEDILVDVVRIGNDTDTNGAVAGGLLGARDGIDGIPERWRAKLQFREEFIKIGLELTPE
ncbi:ADP-ribosylglycohydrolase family protein [Pochonia chlamydosporia 170]|uniref:ADP-ribosylhydrolase ARH3 n=1 Tax=Pochonia chlamydosporia 170 TaxID=1380566 RepID=A0A179FQT0_METCM|nr:ADP-ribosylglycohydrolase family protein [Pochonia chlamydosporia 170]OAQ67618.1 ADP-ribosylglycohydrolase family protein [Pochonia chlamydosporia 170]